MPYNEADLATLIRTAHQAANLSEREQTPATLDDLQRLFAGSISLVNRLKGAGRPD